MKKIFIKMIEWLAITAAIVVLLLAILVTTARILLPHATRYQTAIQQWVSKTLQQPIHIGKMSAAWSGFEPELKFEDVNVLNDAGTATVLQVRELEIGIDIFNSLIKRRIEPGLLVISGLDLTVRQGPDGKITINGLTTPITATPTAGEGRVQDAIEWILTQARVRAQRVNIHWYGKDGRELLINNIRLRMNNRILQHRITGSAVLAQAVPTQLRFTADVRGDIQNKETIKAQVYLKLQNFLLAEWMKQHEYVGLQIVNGNADAEVWLNWGQNKVQSVQSKFTLKKLGIKSTTTDSMVPINYLTGNLFWETQDNGWSLHGDHLKLHYRDHEWPMTEFNYQVTHPTETQAGNQKLDARFLNIADVKEWVLATNLLTQQNRAMLTKINPKGELTNLTFNKNTSNLISYFDHLSWQHYQKLPAVTNLSGLIEAQPNNGTVTLNTANVKLDFGNLFRGAIALDRLTGKATWQRASDGWEIKATDIVAGNAVGNVNANMDLKIPSQSQTGPTINLIAGFTVEDASRATQYLPVSIMDKGLVRWLDSAIIDGQVGSGTLVLRGPLHKFPFEHQEGRFVVGGDLSHVTFKYYPGWPIIEHLSGKLIFDTISMTANVDSGQMMGASITQAQATIPNLHKPVLQVAGNVQGDISQGLMFIQQSPLNESIGKQLGALQANGPMQLGLQLTIPFAGASGDVAVLGNVDWQKGKLRLPQWNNLTIDPLQGKFQFTENGVSANNMQGQLFNRPININMSVIQPPGKSPYTQVSVNNVQASVAEIVQQFDLPNLPYVQGTTSYQVTLQLPKATGQPNTLLASSNLQGVSVDLPQPLTKSSAQPMPFNFRLDFGSNRPMQIGIQYNDRLSTYLTYALTGQAYRFVGGEVHIGPGTASIQTQPGLLIDGKLTQFSWAEWEPYLLPKSTETTQKTSPSNLKSLLRKIDIMFDDFQGFGVHLQSTRLQVQPQVHAWIVDIDSAPWQGQLTIPADYPKGTLQANMQRCVISPNTKNNEESESSLTPNQLPSLNLVCNEFRYGDKSLGRVELGAVSSKNELTINHLNVRSASFNLDGTGQWQMIGNAHRTSLDGKLTTNDLGAMLKQWAITDSLINGKGNANFSFNWPKSPLNISLATINGNLTMHFTNGRIINLAKSTEAELGLGRVLNLFSLQSLLNFSNLTSQGFSFNVMQGDFALTNGNANTNNAYLNGPVAKVEMKGRIGLAKQDYDMTLRVLPYVTSSIPVAATIVGGPIAGAVAWVASKILSPAVSHITAYQYKVTGSWAQPNLVDLPEPTLRKQ